MNFFLTSIKNIGVLYGIIGAVVIILIAIFFFVIKKNKYNRLLDDFTTRFNTLNSYPFSVNIAKTDAIARVNNDVADTATTIRADFTIYQDNINEIMTALTDAKEYISALSFKNADERLLITKEKLEADEELAIKLDETFKTVLNQSSMQRKIINELKNNFHEIKTQINDNPNGFAYCWEKLDKMTNDISHLFSEFEVNMDASKYEDAASIAEKISNGISKLDEVVTQLPELIDIAKNKLPDSINSLANNFQLCLNDGVFLQHLNFDGFASAIYSILEVNLKKIKECDLVDVNERLTDCQVRLNQFQRELDQEKVAYRDLKKTDNNCATMLNNISNIINDITDKNSDSFIRYGLDELNSSYNDLMTDYTNCYDNYRSLKSSLDSNSIPATTLIITYLDLEKEISELSKSFSSTSNKLNDTNIAEQRSRDLLNRFTVVLNESKASIRLSQLPGISSQYNKDINDAEQYIIQINDLLTNDVVDINELTRVTNEANNLISSLLKNVNMLISAAQEIEKLIVTCNKYRPYYPKLDAALYSAEFSYRNGVYTKACNIATEALREINPSLAKSLALKINNLLNPRKEG